MTLTERLYLLRELEALERQTHTALWHAGKVSEVYDSAQLARALGLLASARDALRDAATVVRAQARAQEGA